jgi:DNA replication and repair protein RecF
MREAYLDRLAPVTARVAEAFLPELGEARYRYVPGWRRDEMPLTDALLLAQERDLQLGYTSVGPHRGDWRLDFDALPGREALSRGQEKLTALSCLMSQAEAFAEDRGEWPLICLDDLASELDRTHQAHVLRRLAGSGAQVFITGTDIPPALEGLGLAFQQFHVEHGVLTEVLPPR